MARLWQLADHAMAAITGAAKWLSLAIVALLFLQWPLRDLVQRWSREANDLGQILFALFIAVAITAATRARAHLAADSFARSLSPRTRRRITGAVALLVAVPWALAMLYATTPQAWSSLLLLERFPDTANPGYFLIRLASVLLPFLVLIQGLIDVFTGKEDD